MNYKKTVFGWVRYIKKLSMPVILLGSLVLITAENLIFSYIYSQWSLVDKASTSLDYLYFSFVTSFTVGYGDMVPRWPAGKITGIIHIITSALTFAISVSILTAKLFYPKNTVIFSDRIIYDEERKAIHFRVINIHREAIINPEIRIYLTTHCVGNVIAPSISLAKIDDLPLLGIHDFCFSIPSEFKMHGEKTDIRTKYEAAMTHNEMSGKQDSRFRIVVSITGHNGMQQIAEVKKYYASDICKGRFFESIKYTDEDLKKWGNLNYKKIPGIWESFNKII